MNKISVIGLDLAKNVFQVHGIDLDGEVVVPRQASSGGKARLLGISKRGDGYVCFQYKHDMKPKTPDVWVGSIVAVAGKARE